jgi:hypothetical protein
VGDEQAETYLRLLCEAETRRAGRGSSPGIARSVERIRRAGEVLVMAGLLAPEDVGRVATELEAALLARSDQERPRYAQRMSWIFAELTDAPRVDAPRGEPPPSGPAAPGGGWAITPVGRRISVAHDRAPSDLYLMTLVRSPDAVAITTAMRMHWPADGSSADLEITGAGPQHLPYDQLWVADDRGTRYRIAMNGEGGTLTWQGDIWLHDLPPPDARWLDLVADGAHRLARIDLDPAGRAEVRPATATEPDPAVATGPDPAVATGPDPAVATGPDPAVATEPDPATATEPDPAVVTEPGPAVPAGEWMLAAAAERLLANAWNRGGPRVHAQLGETITVLAAAGALAADTAAPAQLAALCERLGLSGHGITVAAAAQIPARWAEVLPPLADGPPGPEWFVPLGPAAADLEGARFAFAGLTSAAGRSFLHVVAEGLPPPPAHRWYTGFSWWVRDDAGGWHLATETDPGQRSRGPAGGTGMVAFRLRLTPPLRARPDAIEVVVTGRRASARVVVPVGEGPEMADT